jgi:hypothetical protein
MQNTTQQPSTSKTKATFTLGLLLGAAAGGMFTWALGSKETLPVQALDLSNKVGRLQEAFATTDYTTISNS